MGLPLFSMISVSETFSPTVLNDRVNASTTMDFPVAVSLTGVPAMSNRIILIDAGSINLSFANKMIFHTVISLTPSTVLFMSLYDDRLCINPSGSKNPQDDVNRIDIRSFFSALRGIWQRIASNSDKFLTKGKIQRI